MDDIGQKEKILDLILDGSRRMRASWFDAEERRMLEAGVGERERRGRRRVAPRRFECQMELGHAPSHGEFPASHSARPT